MYLISRRNSAKTFSVASRTSYSLSARYFLERQPGLLFRAMKQTHRSPSRNSGSHATSSKSGTESSTVNHEIMCILVNGEMT